MLIQYHEVCASLGGERQTHTPCPDFKCMSNLSEVINGDLNSEM